MKFFSELGKIISLHSDYRKYVFIFVLAVLAIIPVKLLEEAPNLSICSRVFGEYCFSVGITRGVSSLLKGDFEMALDYNFLAVPVLIVMIFLIVYDFRNK